MAKARVQFTIDNEGNYLTDTHGIKGQKCHSLDALFKALGEVKATNNGEFYENEQPTDVNIVGQGPNS